MTTADRLRRVHLALTVLWLILVIPTVLWWKTSILWVGLCSCYANAIGHAAAYSGQRAETR
jgi:hypothetical protein